MSDNTMNRRSFFACGLRCTAGLALLTLPGVASGLMAHGEDPAKSDIFKELDERLLKAMPLYRSCAVCTFFALNEQFKLGADYAAMRALMPFTGGIAMRSEDSCGAVSGSLLALGFAFEPKNEQEAAKTGASIKGATRFLDEFTRAFGSIRCKDVVKHQYGRSYNFLDPEESRLFMEASQKGNKCLEVMQTAVRIAGKIILEKV
jgi:C_GCAxxG_C_C family probable redox protein